MSKQVLPHGMINEWDWSICEHEWVVSPGSWELGDVPGMGPREEVVCTKCKCPGERYTNTGEVEWPTT